MGTGLTLAYLMRISVVCPLIPVLPLYTFTSFSFNHVIHRPRIRSKSAHNCIGAGAVNSKTSPTVYGEICAFHYYFKSQEEVTHAV